MSDYPFMEHYRLMLAVREADVIDKANRHRDDTWPRVAQNMSTFVSAWEQWRTAHAALIEFERVHGLPPIEGPS